MQLPYSEEVNIEAPRARDIERVRKYWKLIIQIDPSLRDKFETNK